ncbi:hypothetical protein BD779DRAFT_1676426 [Infundibulicybe gibba]|nr:hypothetical protein BD779DRAFT_1676426 [Infundibulicybe gibba]
MYPCLLLPLLVTALATASVDKVSLQTACLAISKAISPASAISYPGEPIYQQDISHYLNSSVQAAACTVEPGTTHDVAAILNVISTTRVPFGVKGGGHASNPGFSSTPGVLIAMRRFSRVEYDAVAGTAAIGAGLIWDDVYAALAPFGVNVVGGRVPGIGVAGFTLGGGFSWKTNQFGLTIDTVEAFELVKPSGVVVNVTKGTFPDLFFALKGGYNNFGIVTKFTLRRTPKAKFGSEYSLRLDLFCDKLMQGGTIVYLQTSLAAVSAATAKFSSTSTDPKAAIIVSSGYLEGQGRVDNVIVFYDGPNPPPGIFDDYLSIPAASTTVKTNNFGTFISEMTPDPGFPRGISAVASHNDYSPTLLNAIANETNFWGEKLASKSAIFLSYAIEPFLQSIFSHDNSTSGIPPTAPTASFHQSGLLMDGSGI